MSVVSHQGKQLLLRLWGQIVFEVGQETPGDEESEVLGQHMVHFFNDSRSQRPELFRKRPIPKDCSYFLEQVGANSCTVSGVG